ncbi:hypothetical protein JYE83_001522 [Campylobacter upsaliensis]|uniref:hypothetical protein n=3 Tax=Pseudomonadati TaxID=3379134 RepID=UPI00127743D9|nr:hypothetical protein [Campylobacter upsaliensis]EAI8430347.1 hypothetical protein [Campylobacter upsaliensis]EAJ7110474.1 hypothetical protein [Campylobacter upsaliensis]EAJ7571073.1 hypothetical protein [Campylobacter upsaliensis]EFC8624395.1 hypothetical protein [Campylobacter upsaliensis]EHB2692783.1 hypothetical protein [Campylobacter upsaliensis]
MNCFNHNEKVAVGSCQNCNVGLCNECVTNAFKIDNKPICKPCHLVMVESYMTELKNDLANIKIKKIIWTILLIVGALGLIYPFFGGTPLVFGNFLWAFFIWGFGGFVARFERSEKFNNSAAGVVQTIKDRDMYKDGSIWIVWVFKFAFFILRGAFFPLFYLNLMLFGSIKLQNELKECEKIKTELNA